MCKYSVSKSEYL